VPSPWSGKAESEIIAECEPIMGAGLPVGFRGKASGGGSGGFAP